MKLFISVGTTNFDSLLRKLDSDDYQAALSPIISEILLQPGTGLRQFQRLRIPLRIVTTDYFERLDECDVVLCHCGAGTVLDAISKKKGIVAVVNHYLKDNHQTELFDAMISDRMCLGFRNIEEMKPDILKDLLLRAQKQPFKPVTKKVNLFNLFME